MGQHTRGAPAERVTVETQAQPDEIPLAGVEFRGPGVVGHRTNPNPSESPMFVVAEDPPIRVFRPSSGARRMAFYSNRRSPSFRRCFSETAAKSPSRQCAGGERTA